MGLSLQVAAATEVFEDPYGGIHAEQLEERFGFAHPTSREADAWCSDEMGWSWVGKLQETAQRLGVQAPHLAACNAWLTVYLPKDIDLDSYTVEADEMICGSVQRLGAELAILAEKMGIPDDVGAQVAMLNRYIEEDGVDADDDPDVQCLLQFLEGCRRLRATGLPLWVVK